MKTQSVLFAQIAKVDEAQRLVHGRAAQEVLDRSGEIFDYETSKGHFADWSKTTKDATNGNSVGNLRAMHGKVAAGKLTDITFHDDEKAIDIVAKVVDDQEWNKVLEGVYTGFSIGGEYAKKWDDPAGEGKRYTAIPSEISLVDRPCGPTSTFFKLAKADGSEVDVEFKKAEEDEEEKPVEEGAPTEEADKPAEEEADKEEAEKADYVVDGTDQDVENLSKLMQENGLNVGQVVQGLEGLAKAIGSNQLAKALTDASTFAPLVKSTFADPENYKFPLDTADQVKAAWNFLNKDSAKQSYEPEALSKMMEKVKEAWRTKVGSEPDENVLAVKVATGNTLCKGLFDVYQLADVLMDIRFVLANSVWQEKNENAPAHSVKLMAAFEAIAEVINEMIAEELATFKEEEEAPKEVMELSHHAQGLFKSLEKIGARNSKSDAEKIQSMHDNAVALGAACGEAEKHAAATELQKGDTELNKALGLVDSLNKTVQSLTERLQKIEAQPAPAKAVLKVVSKAQDIVDEPAEQVQKVVDHKGEANPVASLIKSVHQTGGQSLDKI